MNDDDKNQGQPIEGEDQHVEQPQSNSQRSEGGAAPEPSTDEIASMYKELGIDAPAPTGKPKGRPKSTDVRAKDDSKKDPAHSDAGKPKDSKNEDKSKDAPDSGKNGDSGDDSDPKGKKDSPDDGEVQNKSKKAGDGVRKGEPNDGEESERGSEEDSEHGDDGTPKKADESEDLEEKSKRPGKSNPEVERRFQKLTAESKDKDEEILKLQKALQESQQAQAQNKIDQEDPKYTIDDFRKVKDENGKVYELDDDMAELAFRRWEDGYNQRAEQRNAQANHEAKAREYEDNARRAVMQSSADAYDTLSSILSENPRLQKESPEFDQEFSDDVMPLIEDAIIYQPGTEPGNEEKKQPIIIGLRMNPGKLLKLIDKIQDSKRDLPLNGTHDNVESRSNVSVPHSRSSDPTVNQANELMKTLKINKRF